MQETPAQFEGFESEVAQTDHSQAFPELGLIITPKEPTIRDAFRTLVELKDGPEKIQELLDRFGYLILRAIDPKYQYALRDYTYSQADNSGSLFWHSDFLVTGRPYNLLYNQNGEARQVTETGLADREVILPRLPEFFETHPDLLEQFAEELQISEARTINSQLHGNFPSRNNFDAWAKIAIEHRTITQDIIAYPFAQFLGSAIAKVRIGKKELLLFSNATTREGAGLLHSRIVPPQATETVATHRNEFSNAQFFRNVMKWQILLPSVKLPANSDQP